MQSITGAGTSRRRDLDVIRGVAILLTLGWHFGTNTGVAFLDALQLPGQWIGWAGVDLFFVLSGFLIGGLIFREHDRTGAFRWQRFLTRRAFKIWPVLYLYVALLLVTGRYRPDEILLQVLFHVQNFFETPARQLWSLAVEEHFYLAFALIFGFAVRRRGYQPAHVPRVLLGIMVAAFALRCAAQLVGWDRVGLQWQTQFRADALACGVLLAWLHTFQRARFDALAARKAMLLLLALAGAVALAVGRDVDAFITTIGFTIALLAAAATVLLAQSPAMDRTRNPLLRGLGWVGVYSYATYVFQLVPFRAGEAAWAKVMHGAAMPPVAELALKYVGAILVGFAITKAIERPMLALRDRLFPADARQVKDAPAAAQLHS